MAKKRKMTRAERAEFEARYERTLANAERTRQLAEKAQAKLDAERSGK
jgi:DNA-directed RNA polymerase subunit K/omega